MVKILLKLLPDKYKVAFAIIKNLFSAVDTWYEVEELGGWISEKLSATGQFDIAEWGELGGKLHIIGAPKHRSKPRIVPEPIVAYTS